MSALWTSAAAAAATGGRATADWVANGVSIDTRTLHPGDLFVALKAQRDGHDFVAEAFARGAAAAMVVQRPEGVAPAAPLLMVADPQKGLEALAVAARARFGGRVVGVTGSAGKTSTKEMLRAALSRQGQGRVHAAEASHNNHWGVPLTLARLPADAGFAVIEIGMSNPGEIAPLARMARPHVAMITTVAPAHMAAFADGIDGIAREKAAIFEGVEPDGVAVLNGDIGTAGILNAAAGGRGIAALAFGETDGLPCRLSDIHVAGDCVTARAVLPGGNILFRLAAPGRHFARNALGVLAVVGVLGGDVALAALGLADWRPPAGRGRRETILLDPADPDMAVRLIDDSFNANPASMAAALEVLAESRPERAGRAGVARAGKGRRIAVLGDMLELGPDELQDHTRIAGLAALGHIDLVHCAGPRMRALWEALPPYRRGAWAAAADDLAARAHELINAGDIVLVKGSKASRVSRVVDAIRNLGHPAPQQE